MQETREHLVRGLGPIAAISVNVGNIIGTGIFLKARVMTCNVGTPTRVILVWIVAGLLALALEGIFSVIQRIVVPPGVSAGRPTEVRSRSARPRPEMESTIAEGSK